ncbi:MAG: ATP-dependent Clp protease proteolytic subunit [Lachnospiraceae bacterium]|nr:ATP-dependent Clp protease proteolytic subunit [Lachnospiraceae bacterium]
MSVSVIEKGYNGSTLVGLKSKLYEQRIVFLEGEINSETACEFTREMMFLIKDDEKPITIFINSNGGEVTAGLQIVDVISSCKVPVYICCIGHAYSIAALILSSGEKGHRFILPLSKVMIHELYIDSTGGTAVSVKNTADSMLKTRMLINGLLAKYTAKSIEEINQVMVHDFYLDANAAVEFGIVDKVLGFQEMLEVTS